MALGGFRDEPVKIGHCAVLGVDGLVVGNVISEINLRRWEAGCQPDGITRQLPTLWTMLSFERRFALSLDYQDGAAWKKDSMNRNGCAGSLSLWRLNGQVLQGLKLFRVLQRFSV